MKKREVKSLADTAFDALIVGGGINGAGVARDAAMRGLKVLLVEKNDFASGTSSKSSKLVHGGIRYLEQGKIKLVYEALHERKTLMDIAPHLVKPLHFLIPFYNRARGTPAWKLRLGMTLYDVLSGRKNIASHELVPRDEALFYEASLLGGELKNAGGYYDAQMNDARMTLENILSAEEAGAACLNYVSVKSFVTENGKVCGAKLKDELSGDEIEVKAKKVVNAAGPWGEMLQRLTGAQTKKRLRHSKGVHLILPRVNNEKAFLLFAQSDGRVFFVLPWGDYSIVGTTDTDYKGDIDNITTTNEEVEYLLNAARDNLNHPYLSKEHIVSTYAGVRPLVYEPKQRSYDTSREHEIFEDDAGLLCIFGGKFTTYRVIAKQATDKLMKYFPDKRAECATAQKLLYGGNITPNLYRELSREFSATEVLTTHLVSHYGARAREILELIKQDAALGEKLCVNHNHIAAEVVYAATHEKSCTLSDFFSRRTFIRHSKCRGLDCIEKVKDILQKILSYDADTLAQQEEKYKIEVKADLSFG